MSMHPTLVSSASHTQLHHSSLMPRMTIEGGQGQGAYQAEAEQGCPKGVEVRRSHIYTGAARSPATLYLQRSRSFAVSGLENGCRVRHIRPPSSQFYRGCTLEVLCSLFQRMSRVSSYVAQPGPYTEYLVLKNGRTAING